VSTSNIIERGNEKIILSPDGYKFILKPYSSYQKDTVDILPSTLI
jgi:hypothetical protein